MKTTSPNAFHLPVDGSDSDPLSKFWTLHLQKMENEGRFRELIETLTGSPAPMSHRQRAALARAHALAGDSLQATGIVAELRSSPELSGDLESRAVVELAQAALLRRQGRWAPARFAATRALLLARKSKRISLELDSLFGIALALAETGRPFLAVDCYQRIRRHPSVSPYRKNLALLNEMWSLWDLGRWPSMQALLPDLPEPMAARPRLMLEMLRLDFEKLRFWFTTPLPTSLAGERRQIALLLLETAQLAPELCRDLLHDSWLRGAVHELDAEDQNRFRQEILQSILSGEPLPTEIPDGLQDWRSRLERQFVIFLSHLRQRPEQARSLYVTQIEPVLQDQGMATPLIPMWRDLVHPVSPWGGRLNQALKLTEASQPGESAEFRAFLSAGGLTLKEADGRTWFVDLRRRGQSQLALQIIAGPKGREVTKEFIHEQLTGNRYNPRLHDDRIQKLYKRLEREIFEISGRTLWCWPGRNSLKLLEAIQNES